MTNLLEARGIGKTFHSSGLFRQTATVALSDFSLTIEDGRPIVTAIAGESGSGKTTLTRLLLGIIEPTEGEIRYQGVNLKAMNQRQRKQFRQQVQAIFQDPFEVYNPFYKVDHVLRTPLAKFRLARSESEARRLMIEALEKVGLRPEETLGRYPHQLSGGQRQRIMIARALMLNPKIIIADEPVSMVDASLRATILESLLRLHQEFGISLIYVTHDLTTAYQLCNDIFILYRGSVAEAGDVTEVIKDPKHPYTQLLVRSIPQPNPDHRWDGDDLPMSKTSTDSGRAGCLFLSRCPYAMPRCAQAAPSSITLSHTRSVACYLYDGQPAIDTTPPQALKRGADTYLTRSS